MQNVEQTKAQNAEFDKEALEAVPDENKDSQQSRSLKPSVFESGLHGSEANTSTEKAIAGNPKAATSRKRYTRAQLEKIGENNELKKAPLGFNPELIKQTTSQGEVFHEGQKWNRNRTNRDNEGTVGSAGKNKTLRGPFNNNERYERGERQERSRRNSRTDQTRWDSNKDDPRVEKRYSHGPERWGSYGHRENQKEQEVSMSVEEQMIGGGGGGGTGSGKEPEWMKDQSETAEASKKQRQKALDFEGERRRMREQNSKRGTNVNIGSKDPFIMTDDEISKYQKELETENAGAFTFDTLKAAMKQAGVSNLPPMPTSGASTVDQIEKSLKTPRSQGVPVVAAAATAVNNPSKLPSQAALERERIEVWKAVSGQQNAAPASTSMEGANLLLSLLRGTVRPTNNTGIPMNSLFPLNPQPPMPQAPILPTNLQQQPQLNPLFPGMAQQPLAPANNPLDRFFNAQQQQRTTPSASILNLGIGAAGAGPQQPQPPVAAPNLYNMSALQQQSQQPQQQPQAQQQSQQALSRSPLLSALLMNQAQQPQNAQPMIGQFPQFQTHIPLFQQQQQSNHGAATGGGSTGDDLKRGDDTGDSLEKLGLSQQQQQQQQQASQSLDQVPRPTPALMSLLNRGNPNAAALGGAGAGQGASAQAKLNLAQMQPFNILSGRVPANSGAVQQGQGASSLSNNPYSLFGSDNDPTSINPALSAFGTGPIKKKLPIVPYANTGSSPSQGGGGGASNVPQHRPLNPSAQIFIPSVSVQSMLPRPQQNTAPINTGAFPQVISTSASSSTAAATTTTTTTAAAVQQQTNTMMLDSLNAGNSNMLGQQSTTTPTPGVNTALNQLLNTTDAGQVSSAARRDRSMEELKNKA